MTGTGRRLTARGSRFVRLLSGTVLMGAGIALLVRARLGLLPLDVLKAALSDHTGWTMGGAFLAVQAVLLLTYVPLRLRPGVGTIVAATVPAVVCDLVLALLPDLVLVWRLALFPVGGVMFALGIALYLSAGMGVLPRDGLMQELHRRRPWMRPAVIRIVADVACLLAGWLLLGPVDAISAGVVGVGSVLLSLTLGPAIERLRTVLDRPGPDKLDAHHGAGKSFESRMPRADRMMALRALLEHGEEPALQLWPALMSQPPVCAVVGPAEPPAMSIESFLDFARRNGVRIVYGTYVDGGAADELVPLHHGLVLQYPVAGGVVHCWTAAHGTGQRQQPDDGGSSSVTTSVAPAQPPTPHSADQTTPGVDVPGGPTGAVTALNHLTVLRLAR